MTRSDFWYPGGAANHVLASDVMMHRHLKRSDFSPPVVDDIIARGRKSDWAELADAMHGDPAVRQTVERVCAAYVVDPYAQRYHFWKHYAELLRLA